VPTREEVRKEYNELFRKKPNKWGSPDRSDYMITVLKDYISNPKEVLDVGCGNGVALQNYRSYNHNAKLYGIDPSDIAIRIAKAKVPDAIFTINEKFDDIDKFELVICLGVAEHVEDLPLFLKYLKDFIKPGGYCYFEVPHNLVYSPGDTVYRRLTVGSKQIEWHLQRNTWEQLLLDAGFDIVKEFVGPVSSWEFIWLLQ